MMDIAVMTMVHKEIAFLQQWLRHYEPLVGRENLYILTHGDDAEVQELCRGCRLVYVPRKNVDWRFDRLRFRLINSYSEVLLNNYECVISGDVDELVFADPDVSQDLRGLIAANKDKPIMTAFGMHICETPEDAPFDRARPIFSQRNLAVVDDQYCKPHIVFKEPKWARGFHGCAHEPNLVDGLYMTHLKFAFREVSNEISSMRKSTFDSFDNLGNQSLARFWCKSDMLTLRMYKSLRGLTQVPLDSCIDEMRAELRTNIVENYANRGGKSMKFIEHPTKSLRLPERFRQIACA